MGILLLHCYPGAEEGWVYFQLLLSLGMGEAGILGVILASPLGIPVQLFSVGVQNMILGINWVAGEAPDAKLPRFCTDFRPESDGTSSGP